MFAGQRTNIKANTPHIINERDTELQQEEDDFERTSTGGFYGGVGHRQGPMTTEDASDADNLDQILNNNMIQLSALNPEANRLQKKHSDLALV